MSTRFEDLAGSYSTWWTTMVINPSKIPYIDKRVGYLLTPDRKEIYKQITDQNDVPIVVLAATHEREGSGSMSLSLAQGDPWNRVSIHEPRGIGPFKSFIEAALYACRIDGLDKVGKGNWTIARVGYSEESYNGFGPRLHGIRSGYVVGGTNLQQPGKYIHDGASGWRPNVWDDQIGVFPLVARMLALNPDLTLDGPLTRQHEDVLPPQISVEQIQKIVGLTGADVDGVYGPKTKAAVREWQRVHNLNNTGIVDVATTQVMQASIFAETK